MRKFLTFSLILGLALLCAFSFMPLLWRLAPQWVALVPAAPQFAASGAILTVCLLMLKLRKSAALAAGVAIWNLVQFWPALDFTPDVFQAKARAARPLKVVALNLWYANKNPQATLEYLAGSGADVIGLVEMTPRLKDALLALKRAYPYSVDCIGNDQTCEIMLLSRHPIANAYAGRIDGRWPYIAEAELDWGGRHITVAVTHLSWPFLRPAEPALSATGLHAPLAELPEVPRLAQSLQAANLARHVKARPADLVLMGDFNSASWSAVQAALRAETGLDNRGYLLPSWPTFVWPILRLPIDHVFIRGKLERTWIGTGPDVGSDHLPVEAEIAVAP